MFFSLGAELAVLSIQTKGHHDLYSKSDASNLYMGPVIVYVVRLTNSVTHKEKTDDNHSKRRSQNGVMEEQEKGRNKGCC